MSPGNKIFDALIEVVLNTYRKDMMKGTILVSAEALQPHYTFVIKSQIKNQQSNGKNENIAAESLHIISQYKNNEFTKNSVTKLLDLQAPSFYAKKIAPQTPINKNEIEVWAYENITEPQLQQTQTKINKEISQRKQYIENAFKQQLLQKSNDIAKISYKAFQDQKAREELHKITLQKENLSQKRNERLAMLSQKAKLLSMPPQMLGGAYIVPLSDVEYKKHYGMKRDEEAEKIAMQVAILYEQNNNRKPIDVSANNVGYDIKSTDRYDFKRYIEVKGRVSNTTQVMLSENEFNILSQLGEIGWLYIVANCKTKPKLYCIQNPTNKLSFDQKSKGIQYLLQKQNLEDYTVSDL